MPGRLRLHRRHPRAQGRAVRLLDDDGHRAPATPRSGRQLLQADRRPVRRGVPDVLRPPGRRRHRPEQHAVRVRRGGERPVRRRERRPGDPARRRAGCGIVGWRLHRRCNCTAGQIGEINTNLPGLLAAQKGNTTPFTVEPQGAAIYVTGRPGPTDPAVRQLERDIGSLTNPHDPYTGNDNEPIAAYLAGSVEQEILHLINADPDRTPTFTLFPKPDYFFGSNAACTPARPGAVRLQRRDRVAVRLEPRVLRAHDRHHVGRVRGTRRREHRSGRTRGRPTGRRSTIRTAAGRSRSSARTGRGWTSRTSGRRSCGWRVSRTATSTTVAC